MFRKRVKEERTSSRIIERSYQREDTIATVLFLLVVLIFFLILDSMHIIQVLLEVLELVPGSLAVMISVISILIGENVFMIIARIVRRKTK